LKIALISHLYPTELHPFHGKFIKDQLELLKSDPNIFIDLFVPTPYAFPFTRRYRKSSSPLIDKEHASRLNYLSFPKKKFPEIIASSLSKRITRSLKDSAFDVVHVHWLYPDGLCIPALKEEGFKTVLTIHGSDWYQTRNDPTLVSLLKEVLDSTDRILYSGPQLKADVEKVYPGLASKSDVIYNMVNEEVYQVPNRAQKKKSIQLLGWDSSKINALTVANIREEKGVDLLAEAVKSNPELNEIDFHIVGASRGDAFSQQFFETIDKIPNVFYHPPVPPTKLINFYQAADFFVLPSRREGFNVSILEAMSCGLPVVCTDAGGNKELVENDNGYLAKTNTAKELSIVLKKMRSNYQMFKSADIHHKVKSSFGKSAFFSRLFINLEKPLSN
jgi:glycosyltransferase involved in cell wall biosynthesis